MSKWNGHPLQNKYLNPCAIIAMILDTKIASMQSLWSRERKLLGTNESLILPPLPAIKKPPSVSSLNISASVVQPEKPPLVILQWPHCPHNTCFHPNQDKLYWYWSPHFSTSSTSPTWPSTKVSSKHRPLHNPSTNGFHNLAKFAWWLGWSWMYDWCLSPTP